MLETNPIFISTDEHIEIIDVLDKINVPHFALQS